MSRLPLVVCVMAVLCVLSIADSSLPKCKSCVGGTSGACQQSNGVCWASDPLTGCPTGTSECTCDRCKKGTSGPCKRVRGTTCKPYDNSSTQTCPDGFYKCAGASTKLPSCVACAPGTNGECQQANGVCWAVDPVTGSCPTGTTRCKCPKCKRGKNKPCRKPSGSCVSYEDAATRRCPAGTFECFRSNPLLAH
jgi:hypothetical protein